MITGQMYFNSSTNKVRVYDGTSWVDAGSEAVVVAVVVAASRRAA